MSVSLRWFFFTTGVVAVLGPPATLTAQASREGLEPERITLAPVATRSWQQMQAWDASHPELARRKRIVPPPQPMPLPPALQLPYPPADFYSRTGSVDLAGPRDPAHVRSPRGADVLKNFVALEDNNVTIPPDTMGAAGPNHLMTILNSQVRIQNKNGGNISTVSLNAFWNVVPGDPFDPRILFDDNCGRWFALAAADPFLSTSSFFFAVSDTADPTGNWSFYRIDADSGNTTWLDFPGMGINKRWIAVAANMFGIAGGFAGAKMWAIQKSTTLDGGIITFFIFPTGFDAAGGAFGFSLQPAVTSDRKQKKLYIVDNTGFVTVPGNVPLLRLSHITGRPDAPKWKVVRGSIFAGTGLFPVDNPFNFNQADADQSGTNTLIATNDTRISSSPNFRNGRLWVAHTGGLPSGSSANRTAVFWYELDPKRLKKTGDPILQSGVLDGGANVHHSFPSIAANQCNEVCLGFSRSSLGKFVESAATGRRASDPPGTMDPVMQLEAGKDSYVKNFGGGEVRWGDYSSTVTDPSDDLSFWTIQEVADDDVGPAANDDRWKTQWTQKRHDPIFRDDYDNGIVDPEYTDDKGSWDENGGNLIGTPAGDPKGKSKTIADPAFAGCRLCSVGANLKATLPFGDDTKRAVQLFGWVTSGHKVSVKLKTGKNVLALVQKNGKTKNKANTNVDLVEDQQYNLKVNFDGKKFWVFLDGELRMRVKSKGPNDPFGTFGFGGRNVDVEIDEVEVR